MPETLTSEQRSRLMARIGSRNTAAERKVRSAAHALGYRFRIHRADLPGTPDLIFPRYKLAVFVHGCFWHRHPGCRRAYSPTTRAEFWRDKFQKNVARDNRVTSELQRLGWFVGVIWEGDKISEEKLRVTLERFIDRNATS